MSNDVYTRLGEFLDQLPGGYPKTPTGIEIKLLKKMFTPQQAELTLKLTQEPETASQIAERTGLDEVELAENLEDLAQNGLIFRLREGDKRLYQAYQFGAGLFEFQVDRIDREFAALFEEYKPYLGASMIGVDPPQMRTVPVESAIEADSQVAPYNRIREVVKKETLCAVTNCICRKELRLLGRTCSHPDEVCLMFGDWARYYIDNKWAREISNDEAIKILDLAEESGQILRPLNTQKLEALCCCCTCACLKDAVALPNPGDLIGSSYKSVIDPELCIACDDCIEICPMEAVKNEDGIAVVSEIRCIGCGLCVDRCQVGAISMKELEEKKEVPPETWSKTMAQFAAGRGV